MAIHTPLSVVIPSHSQTDLLARCLDSVTQHAPVGTEVIVVDDGSVDAIVSRVAGCFPGVRVLRQDRNVGFCGAANLGIRAARGTVIELLNDDAFVCAGWAEAALAHFERASIGAVAPLVLIDQAYPDGCPRIDSAGDTFDPGGFARKRGHGEPLTDDYGQSIEVFGASGSSAFYRRSALERVGLFPVEFGAYFEDVDLACRLRKAGYRTMYEPGSVVHHRVSASHGKPQASLIRQQSRNEERLYLRNVRGHRFRHAIVLTGKALRRWREGCLMPWLRGRFDAWSESSSGQQMG